MPKKSDKSGYLFAARICIYSRCLLILFGRIPSDLVMDFTGVLEKVVKRFWQDTFAMCV